MTNRSGNSSAARITRALATASYIGKGIIPGQGGGVPVNAFTTRSGVVFTTKSGVIFTTKRAA